MTPRVSVLVCTRNRAEKLRRAVAAILDNSFADFELIVIDQSTDGMSRLTIAAFADPRLRYVPMRATGLARARNLGIDLSRSELVAFTDDDCICEPDWLGAIIDEYARDPAAMGIFGRVLPYGEGKEAMYCPATIDRIGRQSVDKPTIPYGVLGAGNNMSFRKSVFREIGLFIETLGAGTRMKSGEDTEFVYRALRRRLTLVYSSKPLVYHDNWMTRREFAELMKGSILGKAAVFTKYALRFDREAAFHLLRTAYHVSTDRVGVGSVRDGLLNFLHGVAMGLKYGLARAPQFRDLPMPRDDAPRIEAPGQARRSSLNLS